MEGRFFLGAPAHKRCTHDCEDYVQARVIVPLACVFSAARYLGRRTLRPRLGLFLFWPVFAARYLGRRTLRPGSGWSSE